MDQILDPSQFLIVRKHPRTQHRPVNHSIFRQNLPAKPLAYRRNDRYVGQNPLAHHPIRIQPTKSPPLEHTSDRRFATAYPACNSNNHR